MSTTASQRDVRWLLRRLRRMPPAEIVLVRAPRGMRAAAERVARRFGAPTDPPRRFESALGAERLVANDLLFDDAGTRKGESHALVRALDGATREAIVSEAENAEKGRFALFGETFDLGRTLDWHRDPRTGAHWPAEALSTSIDYRPETRPADPKDVWEWGRHQHLVRQALAYRLTGERRHADAVFRAIDSFLEQCRPGRGIHETSALEMARRAQSWILAFSILGREAGARAALLARRAAGELLRVGSVLRRRLSLYSSANNHLVGELSGLALIGLLFEPIEPRTARWRRAAVRLLERAAGKLVHADGSGAERSATYLAYVVDDLVAVERALEREALPVPEAISGASGRGRAFLETLDAAFRPGSFPRFGDDDAGFSFGLPPGGPGGLLSTACLLPDGGRVRPPVARAPWVFEDSGLVLHRDEGDGKGAGDGAVSLFFDAGSLGLPPLFGHGHADALSIALSVGGKPLIVDPGTYAYYRGESWRSYFRGTASHATLALEGRDQVDAGGPFLWESDVSARLLKAAGGSDGRFEASGEHDGYRRLPGSPVVRREITAERRGGATTIRIVDTIASREKAGSEPPSRVSIAFPLDSRLDVEADPSRGGASVTARSGGISLSIEGPSGLALEIARGETGPDAPAGWQSRSFASLEKSPTVRFTGQGRGPFVTTLRIETGTR